MTRKYPYFPAKCIGVITHGELIGDALIKLPFLRAMRALWPDAEIHWISSHSPTAFDGALKDIVAPLIDRVHTNPDWVHKRMLEAPDFDLLIDTRSRWKLALMARLTVPHRLFISSAFRFLFSGRRPPFSEPKRRHVVDRLMQLLELAAGKKPDATKLLPIPADLKAKAQRILPEGQIYIGFAPGAGGVVKKWPLESFEKAAQLQVRMNRVPVFLLGPQELDLYDQLFRSVPEAIFPLQAHEVWGTKNISIEQTLAIASCLDLAVTNDSGTSHMLAAVDCPLVSLFGPTSAEKLAPRVSRSVVLKAKDFGSEDMSAIPVESVHEAVNKLILLRGKI